jgi:hypothetical protein
MLEATRLKDENEEWLVAKRGVVGVGVGEKWVDGKPIDQPAILVFVEKKRTKRGVAQKFSVADLVPEEIDGVPTDVIEVGKIVKQGFTQRVRPIKPGFSCGHHDITAGTMGGFFLDADNEPVILSNNHVLANENKTKAGDLVYQPGPYDTQANLDFRGWNDPVIDLPYVATLKKFILLGKDNNPHDSAVARIHQKLIQNGLVDSLYPTLNRPLAGFGTFAPGMQVQKCGRTTGYTTGRVIGLNASFTIQYDFGPARFVNCAVLSAMSKGGDSGSLIMDMNMNAVGLLFAGSPKVTIASPIQPVIDFYGLKLWNPSGVTAGVDTLDFGDKTWNTITAGGTVTNDGKVVTINGPANNFAYLESPLANFNSVQVTVNSGSDQGATWGPGLTVVWPTGTIKVNVRHNNKFGGYFNGTYNIDVGSVKPNTDYGLRIRKSTVKTWVGEVRDGNRWYTVIELPMSIFPHPPVSVRVGKNDLAGNPSNHSDAGPVGSCTFRDFTQD